MLGGKPGSGAYTVGGLVAKQLEGPGYAVLQVPDREFRRPVIGCEACGWYDSTESCITHLGATMNTSRYDTIQQAAIDVDKDPRFHHQLGIGIILVQGRFVMTDNVLTPVVSLDCMDSSRLATVHAKHSPPTR